MMLANPSVAHIEQGQEQEQAQPWLMRAITCVLLVACWFVLVGAAQSAQAETGKVTATELLIRKQPTTESKALRTVKQGAKLEILETDGDWYKVQSGQVIGYCASQYVSVNGEGEQAGSSAGSIKDLGTPPKASKPGDNNNNVKKLQEALTIAGYYDGRISGNYGELTQKAVKAFQKAKGLTADGVAGNSTIKKLFGKNAAGSVLITEKLDWYKDNVTKVIPKDAVFTVKDIRSGRTFKARRWSGGDHIDAEPYTKSDTATMKKCYGGSWSWNRRPVLLQYEGHVYAASMNGMPHGSDDTIANNNFEGVFCIHFLNSKTHGSDKVDTDHQAAVKEAAKANWD